MAGGSKTAVFAAIGANSVVMVAKFGGFYMTGSGAMLAEGIHSLADVGNQSLLAVGMERASKPADEAHPYGYGRDAFIWALMSAVGIFFLGCGVTVAHGVESLIGNGHHEVQGKTLAIGILIFSLIVESGSLAIAVRELQREAKKRGKTFMDHIRTTDDPFGVAVLYEDGAAVLGVMVALTCLALAHFTHQDYWDAIGSILIGLMMGALALNLVQRNRAVLIGKAVTPADQAKLTAILENDPAVDNVAITRATVDGADSFRISAEIDFDGSFIAKKYLEGKDLAALHAGIDSPEKFETFLGEFGSAVIEQVGSEIDRIEAKVAKKMPRAKNIALEPD